MRPVATLGSLLALVAYPFGSGIILSFQNNYGCLISLMFPVTVSTYT